MRVFGHCLVGVCLVAGVLVRAQGPGTQPAADAAMKVLATAREALGGDKKLTAVTSFVVTGRTRQIRGDNLVPIEFEIAVELPDKYVRKDEIPAQESGPTSTGFNGDGLIQVPVPPLPSASPTRSGGPPAPAAPSVPGRPAGPPPDPRIARVNTTKQDFVRLTLGMFATSFSSYPLTFTYAGKAEAPQGKADAIDAKGPGTFAVRLFINDQTHLPIMLSWQVPPTNVILTVPGQPPPATVPPGAVVAEGPAPPGATATQEEKDQYTKDAAAARKKAMTKLVEDRIYYADYRDADGLQFPFRIRKAIGADTVEETTFDRFRINAKIDPKKFEVVK